MKDKSWEIQFEEIRTRIDSIVADIKKRSEEAMASIEASVVKVATIETEADSIIASIKSERLVSETSIKSADKKLMGAIALETELSAKRQAIQIEFNANEERAKELDKRQKALDEAFLVLSDEKTKLNEEKIALEKRKNLVAMQERSLALTEHNINLIIKDKGIESQLKAIGGK